MTKLNDIVYDQAYWKTFEQRKEDALAAVLAVHRSTDAAEVKAEQLMQLWANLEDDMRWGMDSRMWLDPALVYSNIAVARRGVWN